ncbi:hypothetical protein K438DRAFT_1810608 [Mycena galopus ATCC 62051]|nr:hypothetical protein K438DRAFT_1810608 [Mycena galopus ATCC 62051]
MLSEGSQSTSLSTECVRTSSICPRGFSAARTARHPVLRAHRSQPPQKLPYPPACFPWS